MAYARCALHLAQDELIAAIVEGERENPTVGCHLCPVALVATALSGVEGISKRKGGSDRGAVVLEDRHVAAWPAPPQTRALRVKQPSCVRSEGPQHVVEGRRGCQLAGEIGQALA